MANDNLPNKVRQTLATQNKGTVNVFITTTGDNNTFAFDREDYTPNTMAIANAEVVGTTEDAKNEYTLREGHVEVQLTRDGRPAAIEDGGPGGDKVFADEFQSAGSQPALASFENTSHNTDNFDFKVLKGKEVPTSANDLPYKVLLGDLNDNGGTSRIAQNTQRILQNNNRFSDDSPYVVAGTPENLGNVGKVVVQGQIGKHSPKSPEQTVALTIQNLKNLGIQLLMKGSGEYVIPENVDDMGSVIAAKAASMAPGLARMGIKVPVSNFDTAKIMAEVHPGFVKPKNPDIADGENLSYGSYNNPLAPFDAIDSRSSAAAASILVTTISLILEALSVVFNPKDGLQSPVANSIFNTVNNAAIPTDNDYTICVGEGLSVFFGISNPSDFLGAGGFLGTLGNSILGGYSKFDNEPGYYNTILRNLTKMITYEIGQAAFSAVVPPGVIQGQAGPFDASDGLIISNNVGLQKDPTNLLNMVRRITQSKIVGFMNTMANLGDISLALKQTGLDINNGNTKVGSLSETLLTDTMTRDSRLVNAFGSTRDAEVNPAALIYKQHLSPGASALVGSNVIGTLAWGNSTTPSTFILPSSIPLAGSTVDGPNGSVDIINKLKAERGFTKVNAENRISSDIVEAIENELEASYVPFYFHDLRTNEVVSFHAFLENITDSFDAEYAEETGYGRIGKVAIYKNTNRAIGLSFRVVAVNPQDFDGMWWKINKLVTLVYPQYTVGRKLEFEGQKFVQPFSQLPSASPLVRIRLGDIMRSNYSKLNLARLFGLGQGQEYFSLSQQNANRQAEQVERIERTVSGIRTSMLNNVFTTGDTFFVHHYQATTVRRGASTPAPPGSITLKSISNTIGAGTPLGRTGPGSAGSSASSNSRRQQPAGLPTGRYLARVTAVNLDDTGTSFTYTIALDDSPNPADRYQIVLPALNSSSESERQNLPSGSPLIELDDQRILQLALRQVAGNEGTTDAGDTNGDIDSDTQLVRDFFATANANNSSPNPIMKAFNSTKGKGLAGFIKNLRFDWNDSTWNVDGLGGKAPMSCKIDVDFMPVHDLNPGIDANGFNTAPIYPVGNISNATNNSTFEDKRDQVAVQARYDNILGQFNVKRKNGR